MPCVGRVFESRDDDLDDGTSKYAMNSARRSNGKENIGLHRFVSLHPTAIRIRSTLFTKRKAIELDAMA